MKRRMHALISRNQGVCTDQEAKMRRENVTITTQEDVYMIRPLDARKLTAPFFTVKKANQIFQMLGLQDVYMIRLLVVRKLTAPFSTVKVGSQTFQMRGLQEQVFTKVPKSKALQRTWLF